MMLLLVLTGDEFKNPHTINFEEVRNYFDRIHYGSRYGTGEPVFHACALVANLAAIIESSRVGFTKAKKSSRDVQVLAVAE